MAYRTVNREPADKQHCKPPTRPPNSCYLSSSNLLSGGTRTYFANRPNRPVCCGCCSLSSQSPISSLSRILHIHPSPGRTDIRAQATSRSERWSCIGTTTSHLSCEPSRSASSPRWCSPYTTPGIEPYTAFGTGTGRVLRGGLQLHY